VKGNSKYVEEGMRMLLMVPSLERGNAPKKKMKGKREPKIINK